MDYAIVVAIEFVYAIATLALISRTAIVFGMMRIINLAHGEFMVMGSYSATVAVHHGVEIWISILLIPPIVVGVIGLIIERLIIRHLYGRMVETMLATWGLSLFIVGVLTMIFGDHTEGSDALRGIRIGDYQCQRLQPLRYRSFHRRVARRLYPPSLDQARTAGTRDDAEFRHGGRARHQYLQGLFHDVRIRCGVGGLGGRRPAPVSGVFPSIGGFYIGKAFITVIIGGAAPCSGPLRRRPCSASSIRSRRSRPIRSRRGRASARGDRADPSNAARHHRPFLPGTPMIALMRANAGLAAVGVIGIALLIGLPMAVDLFALLQITLYAIMSILALSLAFVWGYGGILCFGQSAFFGLGAYAYAVAVINIGESTLPLLTAVALPAALAAGLGYFMFYSRISDVYVGVITSPLR